MPAEGRDDDGVESAGLLAGLGAGNWDDPFAVPLGAEPGGGGLLSGADTGIPGGGDDGLSLGLVDREEDLDLAPDRAAELDAAAQRHLPHARKGSRKKEALISFSEEDFEEGAQRSAFVIIKAYKNRLFGTTSTDAERWKAIRWFFTIEDDGVEPTFALCCQAFAARIDVLRLRIQYEFFLRWWVAPQPFPFLAVPLPDLMDGECGYIAGDIGRDLAAAAWRRPGILTDELVAQVTQHRVAEAHTALQRLDDRGILCERDGGYWFLTGRNPFLMRQRLAEKRGARSLAQIGGSVHWSRLL